MSFLRVIKFARKLRNNYADKEYHVCNGQRRGLHYLVLCLESAARIDHMYDIVQTKTLFSFSPDKPLKKDLVYLIFLVEKILTNNREPELVELMSKLYWYMLYKGRDDVYKLLDDFYSTLVIK